MNLAIILRAATAALLAGAIAVPLASAQDLPRKQFKVVGTWSNLTNWQVNEMPWWTKEIPAASNNAITAQVQSLSDLGLKGTEIMRMLKLGLFDFAHAVPIYVAEDAALEASIWPARHAISPPCGGSHKSMAPSSMTTWQRATAPRCWPGTLGRRRCCIATRRSRAWPT